MVLPSPTSSGGGSTQALVGPPSYAGQPGYRSDSHSNTQGKPAKTDTAGSGNGSDTIGYEAPRYPLINPPLHPNTEVPGWMFPRVKLQRGFIVREMDRVDDKKRPIPLANKYRFRFLFNPEQISYSTSILDTATAFEYKDPADTFKARIPGQESVSFALFLDRTQEAYDQGASTRGTLGDIEALYRVVNGNYWNQGFLYLSLVSLYLGPETYGKTTLPRFPGYITSINITHTAFTPKMTPIRSLVDLSFKRITSLDDTYASKITT